MKRIASKINSLFNIKLNLDFEGTKIQSREIIDDLKDKSWHQGFKKYMAQVMLFEPKKIIVRNILGSVGIVFFFPILLFITFFSKNRMFNHINVLYVYGGQALNKQLSKRHARLLNIKNYIFLDQYFNVPVVNFMLVRYLFNLLFSNAYILRHPYLILNIIIKLCIYNAFVVKYHPSHIYSFNERSIVGPFITEYLAERGIKHSLIMHGYRTYNVKDAFCSYTKMYVFGPYFKELFQDLGAVVEEYVYVGHPSVTDVELSMPEADTAYKVLLVLQQPVVISKEIIFKLQQLLSQINEDYELIVKPKPGTQNWVTDHYQDLLEDRGQNDEILSKYQVFAGVHSTFLLEAWAYGRKVILLGRKCLSREMVDGPNVLRLTLDPEKETSERQELADFLTSPVHVDWEKIKNVFFLEFDNLKMSQKT